MVRSNVEMNIYMKVSAVYIAKHSYCGVDHLFSLPESARDMKATGFSFPSTTVVETNMLQVNRRGPVYKG